MVRALDIVNDLPPYLLRSLATPNRWGVSAKTQFLTLTFDDRHAFKTPKSLFRTTIFELMTNLQKIAPNEYKIFPELNRHGTLHYHIILHHSNFLKQSKFIGYWRRKFGHFGTDLKDVSPGTTFRLFIYCRKVNRSMAGRQYLALKYIRNAVITQSSRRTLKYLFDEERIHRTNKNTLDEQLDKYLQKLFLPSSQEPRGIPEPTVATARRERSRRAEASAKLDSGVGRPGLLDETGAHYPGKIVNITHDSDGTMSIEFEPLSPSQIINV